MWILIIFAHVGIFGDTDSNALTSIEMHSQARCEAAGAQAKKLVAGTKKEITYVCVQK